MQTGSTRIRISQPDETRSDVYRIVRVGSSIKTLDVCSMATREQVVEGMEAWQAGQLIQNALPFFDAGTREFIMTGIMPEEWDEMFDE